MCGRQLVRGLPSHGLEQFTYLFLDEPFLIGVFD